MANYIGTSSLSRFLLKIKELIPTKTSDLTNDSNFETISATINTSRLVDTSADNVFSGDSKISRLLYFKNNSIANMDAVYKTGFYGTTNKDASMPYKAYWFCVVYCKDETNQIAIQWAMDVGKVHNGDFWMRTVRLNAATTGDGNYIGDWKRMLNNSVADTLYSAIDHTHDNYALSSTIDVLIGSLSEVATSGDYNDLINKPTNISSFANDSGYLTSHQDISGKANTADLAEVATSGSYNDLIDKPAACGATIKEWGMSD